MIIYFAFSFRFIYLFVCVYGVEYACRSEGNLCESVLSFHSWGWNSSRQAQWWALLSTESSCQPYVWDFKPLGGWTAVQPTQPESCNTHRVCLMLKSSRQIASASHAANICPASRPCRCAQLFWGSPCVCVIFTDLLVRYGRGPWESQGLLFKWEMHSHLGVYICSSGGQLSCLLGRSFQILRESSITHSLPCFDKYMSHVYTFIP